MVNIVKIKQLAKEKGISLAHLARKFGVGRGYFNDIARADADIPDERLRTIAEILGTTLEYLRDETDQKEKPTDNGEFSEGINVKFLGRDGVVKRKKLTPELIAYLESIPDSDDDI